MMMLNYGTLRILLQSLYFKALECQMVLLDWIALGITYSWIQQYADIYFIKIIGLVYPELWFRLMVYIVMW